MIHSIPDELKNYKQFVVWKYETRDEKPTKVPYDPRTGRKASVTNSNDWIPFDWAVWAVKNHGYDGIGFVLTKDDPFIFIDLDNPHGKVPDPNSELERQIRISEAFGATYQERSPSGKGLHIICKGSIPSGRRKDALEIYDSERYMTMTGDVWKNEPIREHHEYSNLLWAELGGCASVDTSTVNKTQTRSDDEIWSLATNASNAEKFLKLFNGDFSEYPSQSEADQALINIIAFYTQNREQIKRIFSFSKLAERDKAKRKTYIDYTVNRALDRVLPEVDLTKLKQNCLSLKEELADTKAEPIEPEPIKVSNPYSFPPGLVGELAQYVFDSSMIPNREISLVSALGLLGGIVGQSYNVSGTGLNNYWLLLAKTGRGKEALHSSISKIAYAMTENYPGFKFDDFVGPAEFASPQSLIKYLDKTSQCFVSVFGEFPKKLVEMNNPRNANKQELKSIFLQLYNKSGKTDIYHPMVYSKAENNTKKIKSPNFTFIGEGNPDDFYASLNENMISDGFVPRLCVVEYHGDRNIENVDAHKVLPDPRMLTKIADIASRRKQLNGTGHALDVQLDESSEVLIGRYRERINGLINSGDGIDVELFNRAALKALKIAALVSVGINPAFPVITEDVLSWAISLVESGNNTVIDRFRSGMFGGDVTEGKQINVMRLMLKNWVRNDVSKIDSRYQFAHQNGMIPISIVLQKLVNDQVYRKDRMGATFAINRVIKTLIDCGELTEIPKMQALNLGMTERMIGLERLK